ncbi:exopolysaccharide biosynthesis protein [Rubellimicrobium rubrum]|nr:exopolysaccharide biosynthesis protein [Rubellimicrobium rubrum]
MHQDDPLRDEADEATGPLRRRRTMPPRKKLAQILDELAADATRTRISLADLVQAMHGRAFGALLLIFALPNALPAIPGTSGILGLPLVFLAFQMMLGKEPWLPRFIALRSMPRDDFANLVERINPWLEWADRFTAPRIQILAEPLAQRLIGGFCLLLSVVLALPVPFVNMLPGAALCLIGLGVLERDGLWMSGGIAVGVVAVIVAAFVITVLSGGAWFIFTNAF